ncbi:MAG: marine proteobacterial sortase target protein [Pseudomonadota bacterium]
MPDSQRRPCGAVSAAHIAIIRFFERGVGLCMIAAFFFIFTPDALAKSDGLRLVSPSEATTGALLLESTTPGRYVEAPLLASDVDITISGPIARTRLTQRFENVSDGWIEGIYVFPLPDEAAIDTLRMQIGDRFIEGKIEERQKAKAIYEQAKAEGKKASLMEQERPNIFTNSVANIGPGEAVVVQIEYQETVKLEDGQFSLRFPMVVAPRFNPPPAIVQMVNFESGGSGWGDPVPERNRIEPPVLHPDAGPVNPVSLHVDIDAGFPIGEISSSYHKIAIARDGDARASLTLADETTPANRDFELIWKPKASKAPSAALFTETIEGEPYYLVMVTPPTVVADEAAPAREVTFVIDVSGSMAGESIVQAKQSLALAIRRLQAGDAFNVIAFSSKHKALFNAPQPVSERTVSRALGFVQSLNANGGTMMLPALKDALIDNGNAANRLRQIVFLTDGAIGNEQQLFETIARDRGDARIFTVGIGSAPNSFFMSRAAEIGQGAFTHIGATSEVATRMGALFAKLETPAVTNIQADWPEGAAEIWPSPVPDMYEGEVLVIAARGEKPAGDLTLSGEQGGKGWQVSLPLSDAAERAGVSKLWARKKIASLELDRARPGADFDGLDAAILKTALSHQLISRLTSLVAVDVTPSRPEGEAVTGVDIPLNLPHGWEFDKVFGEDVKPSQRDAFYKPGNALRTRTASADMAAPAPAEQIAAGVVLPQGATLADAKMLRGLIMIGFAGLMILVLRRFGLIA